MNLPSKELLSEVLKLPIFLIQMPPIIEGNNIGYLYGSPLEVKSEHDVRKQHKRINIYELAHKCKEWARKQTINSIGEFENKFSQNCYITIEFHRGFNQYLAKFCQIISKEHLGIDFNEVRFFADTEPEAIFKACEFILNEINKAK